MAKLLITKVFDSKNYTSKIRTPVLQNLCECRKRLAFQMTVSVLISCNNFICFIRCIKGAVKGILTYSLLNILFIA